MTHTGVLQGCDDVHKVLLLAFLYCRLNGKGNGSCIADWPPARETAAVYDLHDARRVGVALPAALHEEPMHAPTAGHVRADDLDVVHPVFGSLHHSDSWLFHKTRNDIPPSSSQRGDTAMDNQ